MEAVQQCDVLVMGGGPAGSAIATLLAQEGRRVVLLEKEHHPRFHIGESQLPGNVELFEKLGVREQVARIGMPKFGIEFVPPDLPYCSYVDFSEGWDPTKDSAWQVRRSELDTLLFRNAAQKGAVRLEGAKVRQVDFDAEGANVRAQLDDGDTREWRARFVVDATVLGLLPQGAGQAAEGLLPRHHRAVPRTGRSPERRHAGRRRGARHGQLRLLQHARHRRARRTYAGWKRHRFNIRDMGLLRGETIQRAD